MNKFSINFLFAIIAIALTQSGCGGEKAPHVFTRVETIAGSNGEFGEPFGIAVKDGEIYVSDGEKGKIHKIGKDGRVGDFATGLDTPSGIAFSDAGDLIVADSGSQTIKIVSHAGEIRVQSGMENTRGYEDGNSVYARFNGPIGVAVSGNSIYVSDTYNDRIRAIERHDVVGSEGSGTRGFADGANPVFDTPLGIAAWQDMLLIADAANRRIRVYDPKVGVWTLAGNGDEELRDGPGASAAFVQPTAIAVRADGRIFVADGNAIREISGLVDPQVTTLAGGPRGFADGALADARFNRPSGLAFDDEGNLLVADSDNRVIRRITFGEKDATPLGTPAPFTAEEFRKLAPPRWPFDPPERTRDIAGTMGEIRGEISPESDDVWLHNGLDIAGAYGEKTYFIRDEKVLDPIAAENFGTQRELLRMPTIGYIHLRLGRDKDHVPFGDERFQFSREASGKLTGIRVPRGTKFSAGERVGTLNKMNHVHLIAGRNGSEMNALAALELPGVVDTIAPTLEDVVLFDENWRPIETKTGDSRIKIAGKVRVVVRTFDRMDGNADRRRLGVYKVGYQLLSSDGSAAGDVRWAVEFDLMPPHSAARTIYAEGSKSGATGETIFNYIVTNSLRSAVATEDVLDLEPGKQTIRVFAADFFGNLVSKDIPVEVTR